MIAKDIHKKVKYIELSTRKHVDDVLSGQYKTHFRGHGLQFSEHRVYVSGDDVRHIDWKASARSKEPLVKKFEEERELNVLLVIDVSGSNQFGTASRSKSDVIAEVAALLAYAATKTGDKVGAIFFSDQLEHVIPPKKGRNHVLRMVREILSYEPKNKGTSIKAGLVAATRIMKHSGIVFVLSDFLNQDFDFEIKRLARRNDVVCLKVVDPAEKTGLVLGRMLILDAETGEWIWTKLNKKGNAPSQFISEELDTKGIYEHVVLETDNAYMDLLVQFFRIRKARRGKR